MVIRRYELKTYENPFRLEQDVLYPGSFSQAVLDIVANNGEYYSEDHAEVQDAFAAFQEEVKANLKKLADLLDEDLSQIEKIDGQTSIEVEINKSIIEGEAMRFVFFWTARKIIKERLVRNQDQQNWTAEQISCEELVRGRINQFFKYVENFKLSEEFRKMRQNSLAGIDDLSIEQRGLQKTASELASWVVNEYP